MGLRAGFEPFDDARGAPGVAPPIVRVHHKTGDKTASLADAIGSELEPLPKRTKLPTSLAHLMENRWRHRRLPSLALGTPHE